MNVVRPAEAVRPDIVIVLADDLGFSDLGCYGGEIETPALDGLAATGLRMSHFYTTPRCCPSRAALLTGLHPHQTGVGLLTDDDAPDGYPGQLNDRCVTVAEVLAEQGYATYLSGKWHLATDTHVPGDAWPTRRGFQRFYGTLGGGGSYFTPPGLWRGERPVDAEADRPDFFYTDAISDEAARFVTDHHAADPGRPLFLYVAYTAPHWPLHAPEEDVARCTGRFDAGWDTLRQGRARRLVELGVLDGAWALSERDPTQPAWDGVRDQAWQSRRMQVYAAQVHRMDAGIGRVVAALEAAGRMENTLFIFLSDNGGCAEDLVPMPSDVVQSTRLADVVPAMTRDGRTVRFGNEPEVVPGPEDTFASYGRPWANLSNTPFREYKHWVHEGGIATPFIVHWPAGLPTDGATGHGVHHVVDVMATVLEATGTPYPRSYPGRDVLPLEGVSMLAELRGERPAERDLFWEHEGNAAVRRGRWKLVRKFPGDWELYDMGADRTELHDLAAEQAQVVVELVAAYQSWARRCGVIDWDAVLDDYRRRGKQVLTEPPRASR